ncbi:MAG: hypothetical protein HGA85_09490 [Nanoarchaeota archaeon]|nr:hypothetical protein [Nanoarchaeota archaeon]
MRYLLLAILLIGLVQAASITAPLVAVDPISNQGILGNVTLEEIDSIDPVLLSENIILDSTTLASVRNAVLYARNLTSSDTSFRLTFSFPTRSVSGGSAGATIALAATCLMQNQTYPDLVLTGDIDASGNILQTGGITQKAVAAANSGYKLVVVPTNQSKYYVYERYGSMMLARHLDDALLEVFGTEVREAGTIAELAAKDLK